MFGPPRKRRRYGWWIVLIAGAVVGLALLTGSLRTETRQLTEFFDESRTLAMSSNQVASDFRHLITAELADVTRDDFDVLMDRLEGLMVENAEALAAVASPDSAIAADQLLGLAFDSWSDGLDDFRSGVFAVTDDPVGHSAVDSLAAAIVQLRVGDLLYARFLDRANELTADLDVTIGEFPVVAFVTTEPALLNADLLARSIRNSTDMGERHDVAILQIVFDPVATGGEGADGEIIFPATDRISYGAVVGNQGNVDEKGLVITITFQSEAGAVLVAEDSAPIDLAAGENRYVPFSAQNVTAGDEYTVTFTLTVVEEDLNVDDNVWESPIRINAQG